MSRKRRSGERGESPAQLSRRRFLKAASGLAAATPFGAAGRAAYAEEAARALPVEHPTKLDAPSPPPAPAASIGTPEDVQALLYNTAPIDPADARYRPLLDDLQGNIVSSNGRNRAHYFFIRSSSNQASFEYVIGLLARNGRERASVVNMLERGASLSAGLTLAGDRTSLLETARMLSALGNLTVGSELEARRRAGGFATSVLFTRHGYRKLKLTLPDAAFSEGLAARWQHLNDPEPSFDGEQASWDARYDHADAVISVAYDADGGAAGRSQQHAVDQLRSFLMTHTELLAEEQGHMLRRRSDQQPIEAFGFRDGISQPRFFAKPGASAPTAWNDFAPLRTVLTPDPHGRTPHACGSYFVFRKLRQDVAGFHRQVRKIASQVNRPVDEVLAETVGRHPSGKPLVAAGGRTLNDFDFRDDQGAKRCPAYAHIRKVNPRGDVKAIYGADRHRVARRGLSFGPELARDDDGLPQLDAIDDNARVGLLFYCAQADIADQFEHLQTYWANNTQAPRALCPGPDAVIGQTTASRDARIAVNDRHGAFTHVDYRSHVEMRGGVYLFAPSRSFLRSLLGELST